MGTLTAITDDGASDVEGRVDEDGRVLVAPATVSRVLGWELKPEGLCRGDLCVPVRGRLDPAADGAVDLVAAAGLLRRPALVDASAGAVVLGVSADDRRRALEGKQLPDFSLPDLDGAVLPIATWAGKKKLLVVFASW
jgi:hypothetical protein